MGLIGSIVGGVAGVAGGLLAADKMKQQEEIFNNRMNEIKAHRDNLYYRDPTQTAENQAVVTEAKEMLGEQAKRAAAAAAIGGGSPESEALAKKQGSLVVGKMLQQQAAQGEQQREQIYQNADSQLDAYTKYLADSKAAQAQSISKAAGGLSGAAGVLPI
jgi:hypothetical protein